MRLSRRRVASGHSVEAIISTGLEVGSISSEFDAKNVEADIEKDASGEDERLLPL